MPREHPEMLPQKMFYICCKIFFVVFIAWLLFVLFIHVSFVSCGFYPSLACDVIVLKAWYGPFYWG